MTQKCTVLPSFTCFSDHLFSVSDFRHLPCKYLVKFFPILSTATFAAGIFIAWVMGNFYVQDCKDSMNSFLFQQNDLSWSLWRDPSMRFLVDSSASTTEAYFCLALLFNAAGLSVLLASSFARHCSWHQNFQLSTRVFHDILEFFTSWINEVNTTQFSSIVKPRFFDCPLLLFFAFRRFRYIFPHRQFCFPLATKCLVWRSFAFLSVPLRTMYIHAI